MIGVFFCNASSHVVRTLGTDICTVNLVQLIATWAVSGLLALIAAFVLYWHRERHTSSLLTRHNSRCAIQLVMLAMNTIELSRAFLASDQFVLQRVTRISVTQSHSTPPPHVERLYVAPDYMVSNSIASCILTIVLLTYHRIVELKNASGLLYVSTSAQLFIAIFRIYQIAEVTYDHNAHELEAVVQISIGMCLLTLAVTDGYSIYKERFKTPKEIKKLANNGKNIGYKHSTATFVSKCVFWWLTPLLWKGYNQPLEQEDLGYLREEDSARAHYDRFLLIYKTAARSTQSPSLWMCYVKSSWKSFTFGGLLKLFGDLSALVGPLSIHQIVEYVERMYETAALPTGPDELNHIRQRQITANDSSIILVDAGALRLFNDSDSKISQDVVRLLYPGWSDLVANGWVVAWLVLLATLVQGGFSQGSTHLLNMTGIRIKTSLQGLVYRKTLLLSPSCSGTVIDAKEMNEAPETGDKDVRRAAVADAGAITNLVTEDALNVMSFFWIVHYVWAIPLKIGLVMYLLYRKLGVSAIIGSFVCILTMTPLQFLIGKAMSSNSEMASKCTDKRLKKIADVFLGIKLIKLNAWEKVFGEKIRSVRNEELKYLNKDAFYWTLMTFLTHVSSVLITFVTLAVYTALNDVTPDVITAATNSTRQSKTTPEFTASRLFSALALFNQLTVPLLIFPITVPIIISAIVSTRRLESFLQQPEVQKEFEGIRHMARILSQSEASLDTFEDAEATVPATDTFSQLPRSKENCFASEEAMPKRRKELIRNSRIERSTRVKAFSKMPSASPRDSLLFQCADNLVVSMSDVVFAWSDRAHSLLIDQLDIPRGRLTVVVGPNASGKSSLLAALLSEMPQLSGNFTWNKYSSIAYVPQRPWLLHNNVRENILFGEPLRPRRYSKVLECCALQPDIELMPEGDMTVIDERGINLSGGQRQRIAIARSLYSSANVVIMDDPLSSLDNEVAKHVFENGIKKMLLKANRSAILVTQKLQLIQEADYIVVMKDGRIQIAGSFKDIESARPDIVSEWKSIMSEGCEKDQISPGRTARERWKLFKNVSKIGLLAPQGPGGGGLENAEEPASTFLLNKRRSKVFGSRHLIYDVPLPIDECHSEDVIIRRRSSSRRSLQRNVQSLHGDSTSRLRDKPPVTRHISSPGSFQKSSFSTGNPNFRDFLNRMSSRRSNQRTRLSTTGPVTNSPVKSLERSESGSCSSECLDNESAIETTADSSEEVVYDEERKYGEIPTQIYMSYLKSCGLPMAFTFFASALLWQCVRVYTDVWLQNWTMADFAGKHDVMYYFTAYAIISAVCIVMALVSTLAGQAAGCRSRQILHDKLLNAILAKSLHFFQTTPMGRILNRFGSDMAIIDKKIAATSQRLLQFTLLCLFAVLINVSITPWFVLQTLPICAVYFVIQKFYRCSSRELQRLESITNSPVISHFGETIEGVTTIRAFSQEARFTEILFRRLEANTIAFVTLNASNRWLGISLDYLGGFIVFVGIVTALVAARMGGDRAPSPSLVGLAINYTLLVPIYLNWVVKLFADMEMYVGSVDRVAYYTTADGDGDEHAEEKGDRSVPISWPQRSDIRFEDVSLRYPGQKDDTVVGLTLQIPSGQRVGICGRTGSGKSTLALSLFSVVKVSKGRLLIDDVDISQLHSDEVRSRLSIIPQDVHLFDVTIKENLDPRGYYSDLELWNCLELAQLKDVVSALPLGLDTIADDGGKLFSAGQRQLFCLARAVLRGSVCLVLDEATSSLDARTEAEFMDAAHNAFKGRTIVTIAHRLVTILNYDRIIVVENGRIVEDGSPDQLRNDPSGKFVAMLKSENCFC